MLNNFIKFTAAAAFLLLFSAAITSTLAQPYQFRNFISENATFSLLAVEDGVWVGTAAALLKKNLDGVVVERYTFEDGLPSAKVFDISIDENDHLWLGTERGLVKFDGEEFTLFSPGSEFSERNMIGKVLAVSSTEVWAIPYVAPSSGTYLFDGNSFSQFLPDNSSFISTTAISVAQAPNGKLWFATGNGVATYENGEWTLFDDEDQFGENAIGAIAFDSEGVPLFASHGDGIFYKKNGTWYNFTNQNGLPGNEIIDIKFDDAGVLWAVSYNGIGKLQDGIWTNYTPFNNEEIPRGNPITHRFNELAVASNNKVWIADSNLGTVVVEDGDFLVQGTENQIPENEIAGVHRLQDGRLLIADRSSKLTIFNGSTWEQKDVPSQYAIEAFDVAIIDENEYWLATSYALVHYLGDSSEVFDAEDGLVDYITAVTAAADGSIWVTSYTKLSRYRNGAWTHFTDQDGYQGGYVEDMTIDADGVLWIASNTGLTKYDGDEFIQYNQTNGLINAARCIFIDSTEKIWVGSNNGVHFFDGLFWQNIRNFVGSEDRWETVETIAEDSDGNMWFGTYWNGIFTYDGVSFYKPDSINNTLPSLHIRSIEFENNAGNFTGNGWISTNNGLALRIIEKSAQSISHRYQSDATYGDHPIDLQPQAPTGLPVSVLIADGTDNVNVIENRYLEIKRAGDVEYRLMVEGNILYAETTTERISLKIGKANLVVRAKNKQRLYGDQNPTFNIAFEGFVYDDTADDITPPLAATTATPASMPGEYTIKLEGGSSRNYLMELQNGKLTIEKAPLTVSVVDITLTYGEELPDKVDLDFEGFKLQDKPSDIRKRPDISNLPQGTPDADTYPILLSGGNDESYELRLVDGKLKILQADQTISFPENITFGIRDLVGVLEITSSSGLPVNFELLGGPAELAGNVLTFKGIGAVEIKASQAGNQNYLPAEDVTRAVLIAGPTSMDDTPELLSLYPNPTGRELHLRLNFMPKSEELIMMDALGRTVFTTRLNDQITTFDISYLPKGIYFLSVGKGVYRFMKEE